MTKRDLRHIHHYPLALLSRPMKKRDPHTHRDVYIYIQFSAIRLSIMASEIERPEESIMHGAACIREVAMSCLNCGLVDGAEGDAARGGS